MFSWAQENGFIPKKYAAGIEIRSTGGFDPNRATEMPGEPSVAMPTPVLPGAMIWRFVPRPLAARGGRRGGPTVCCWLSGAARRAVNWTAPTSHFAMPLTPNKTKGGSQPVGLDQKSFTGE